MDEKNAFLHRDLREEVYMDPPPSFVTKGQEGKVCLLSKTLYMGSSNLLRHGLIGSGRQLSSLNFEDVMPIIMSL